ncbi:MAG: serine hydrolase [Deinococcota bacterium]|nr:serine hydrolase [Deinococcota bacterium]
MNIKGLESFIFDKMTESRLPGLSLALVEGGEVVYSRGFGQRDLERGLPATPETLYSVGSVTKSVTALAVLQLAERGLLDLQDPVARFLPFEIKPLGETVRLEHLLTHSLGIPALAYSEAVIRHAHGSGGRALPLAGPEDILTFMAEAESWVETAPGQGWFYSNEGYAMLGAVIQKVSGRPYGAYIRDEILLPLGMTRSLFARDEVERDADVAVPYLLPQDGRPEPGRYLYRTIRSEGGLISNVLDLSHYLTMFLEGGKGVVAAASLEAMTTPRLPMPYRTAPDLFGETAAPRAALHYGYGLHIDPDFYGETLIGHGGSVLVATAHLAFMPRRGLGVALLANGSGYPLAQMAEVALAMMLGEEPGELPFMQVERALEPLTGHYRTYKGTLQATVRRRGDFLELELHDRAQPQTVILVPEELDESAPSFVTFAGGRRLAVAFRRRENGVELVFERYKLRRS